MVCDEDGVVAPCQSKIAAIQHAIQMRSEVIESASGDSDLSLDRDVDSDDAEQMRGWLDEVRREAAAEEVVQEGPRDGGEVLQRRGPCL